MTDKHSGAGAGTQLDGGWRMTDDGCAFRRGCGHTAGWRMADDG